MNRKQSWNIVTFFLVIIFGLTAATLLKQDRDFSENENRALASMPTLTLPSLLSGDFATNYENYLTDQFVFRDGWIGLKTTVERLTLRQETNDIYFADDDYLIEKHTGSFETEQAKANITYLAAFMEKMSETYGSDHLTAMVVPNAVDILRDKLPPFASPYDEEDYLEQIRNALPDGVWFDTSRVLQQHKDEEIYYRTDHHWKTLAAYYVYAEWIKEKGLGETSLDEYEITTVSDEFEGTVASKVGIRIRPDTLEIFEPADPVSYLLTYNRSDDVRSTVYQMQVLDSKDKYSVYYGGNYGLIEAKTNAGTGRRLLIIKDSYAHCFTPFTYQLFDQVDMLDLRYFNDSLEQFMEGKDYTDVLFLYNAAGFAEDTSLVRLTT